MLEGSGCKEGRVELANNVLSLKPTNNHPSLAYLFVLVHGQTEDASNMMPLLCLVRLVHAIQPLVSAPIRIPR